MKYLEKIRKPILFLEDWSSEDDENVGFLSETQWVCERVERTRQWTVKNVRGKTKKF